MDPRIDFWTLPEYRLTGYLTERVEKAFYKRCPPEERPLFIQAENTPQPHSAESPQADISRQTSRSTKAPHTDEEKQEENASETVQSSEKPSEGPPAPSGKPEKAKKHDANLAFALHNVFWFQFWSAGICKLFGGSYTRVPLERRIMIVMVPYPRHSQHNHAARQPGPPQLAVCLVHICACIR